MMTQPGPQRFPPHERLGDFLRNKKVSQATVETDVETLRNFLCNYEAVYRRKIINAQLPRYYNRTSVHLAAERGIAPFLRILFIHGGEF